MSTPKKGSARKGVQPPARKGQPAAKKKLAPRVASTTRPPQRALVRVGAPPIRQRGYGALMSMPGNTAMPTNTQRDRIGNRLTTGPKGTGLSKCALIYAKALINPFGEFEDLPCTPSLPAVPTYRFRALTRGQFVTSGATGSNVGFVCVVPDSPSNNGNSVYTTGLTYAGTTFAISGTGVVSAVRGSLPFTAASFDTMQARLVGSGLRIRNISQALNVGGIVYGLQTSSNESLTGLSFTAVSSDARTIVVPSVLTNQADWITIVWRPNDMSDIDMKGGGEDFALPSVPTMGFLAYGPGTTSQTFEYEMVEFWEFMGESQTTGLRPPELTASHSDPVGLSRVLEGAQTSPLSGDIRDWIEHGSEKIVEAMVHSDTVSKTVEDLLGLAAVPLPMAASLVKSLIGFFAL